LTFGGDPNILTFIVSPLHASARTDSLSLLSCYDFGMKKKLFVAKPKFDAALTKFVHTKPVPRTSVKATGKRGRKR
jgi:hypothetical protein